MINATLSCNGADVEAPATRAVNPGAGNGTTWNVQVLNGTADCTAVEDPASVPPGYTTDNSACAVINVETGGSPGCAITNGGFYDLRGKTRFTPTITRRRST